MEIVKRRLEKQQFRTIGVDDGHFELCMPAGAPVPVCCVGIRDPGIIEFVKLGIIRKDMLDVTEVVIRMLLSEEGFLSQCRCIFTNGITFGGFNPLDLEAMHNALKTPVASLCDRKPDLSRMEYSLKLRLKSCFEPGSLPDLYNGMEKVRHAAEGSIPDSTPDPTPCHPRRGDSECRGSAGYGETMDRYVEDILSIIKRMEPRPVMTKKGVLYSAFYGLNEEELIAIINASSHYSLMPECLRVAHLIASASSSLLDR